MRAMRWLVMLCLLACSRGSGDAPVERAFYFWRTTFQLSAAERGALARQRVTKLYVRAFDIDESGRVVGGLSVVDKPPPGIEIVPVVFLRQDLFQREPRARELAELTWAEVRRRMQALGVTPRELQLDCDWTDRSREQFFAYVREVKAVSGVTLSSTIRLHQVKYRERTGVPPVERGMLMFYNMGEFSSDADRRAIFDAEIAEKYLARIADYPLPLDLALPIWSWTVHVRDDVVVDLLQATDPDELPRLDFVRPGGDDRFVVTRTAFLHGTLLREGDVLKVERMTPADTLAAAELVRPHLQPRTLTLFDLSERNLTRYVDDDLDQVFRSAR
jgi:hypothetical protein